MIQKKAEELWITNISRTQDISVGDLRLTIRRGQSLNLLAKSKRGKPLYNFTRKQIDTSIEKGSIAEKANYIKIRKVAPVVFNHQIDIATSLDRKTTRLKRKPTEIEVPDFPDLDGDDDDLFAEEKFAAENADMDFADRAPALAVDPRFKVKESDDED